MNDRTFWQRTSGQIGVSRQRKSVKMGRMMGIWYKADYTGYEGLVDYNFREVVS